MVTHELRSPLVAIKSATAMAKGDLSEGSYEQVSEMLDSVDQQADRLLGLVNNLLDVSQMEAGAFTVQPGPGWLAEVVEESLATIAKAGLAADTSRPAAGPHRPRHCPGIGQPLE